MVNRTPFIFRSCSKKTCCGHVFHLPKINGSSHDFPSSLFHFQVTLCVAFLVCFPYPFLDPNYGLNNFYRPKATCFQFGWIQQHASYWMGCECLFSFFVTFSNISTIVSWILLYFVSWWHSWGTCLDDSSATSHPEQLKEIFLIFFMLVFSQRIEDAWKVRHESDLNCEKTRNGF